MEENFFSESIFHEGGKFFWANLLGVILHGKTNDQIMPRKVERAGGAGGGGSFTDAFSGNRNTVNLNIFPNHGGIFT